MSRENWNGLKQPLLVGVTIKSDVNNSVAVTNGANSGFTQMPDEMLKNVCYFLDLVSLSKLSKTSKRHCDFVKNAFENTEAKESIKAIKTFILLRERFLNDPQFMNVRKFSEIALRISAVVIVFEMFRLLLTCDDTNACFSAGDAAIWAAATFSASLSLIALCFKKQLTQEEVSAVQNIMMDDSPQWGRFSMGLSSRFYRDVEAVFKDIEFDKISKENIKKMKPYIKEKMVDFFSSKMIDKERTGCTDLSPHFDFVIGLD